MFAKLNDNEKRMIETYIDMYARSESEPDASARADLETVLRPWAQNKQELFDRFGGEFVLERQIEYPMDIEELEDKIYKQMNDRDPENAIRKFRVAYYEALERVPQLIPSRYSLMELVRPTILANNKYDYCSFTIKDPTGKDFKIPDGCKPVKMLGKLAKMFNIPYFEEFRLAMSMITNQKNLHGTLCLSIHPLDYMTMSDNDYDWESCMSWKNVGCYRQGTVEMMNSPYVVVAYLKGENPMKLFGYGHDEEWSNKKWRELFIIHDDVVSEIKGYPYQSTLLVDKVLEWIREIQEERGIHYDQEIYFNHCNNRSVYDPDGKPIRLEFWTNMMYNDFGTMDRGHHCLVATDRIRNEFSLCYSGPSECMWCGSISSSLPCEEALVCEDCEHTVRCDHCGSHGWDADDFVEVDGIWMCPDCYENSVRADEIHSSEYERVEHIEENMERITLSHDEDVPTFDWHEQVIFTYNDFDCEPEDFDQFFIHGVESIKKGARPWGGWRYYVTPSELTEKGWELFGLYSITDRKDYVSHVPTGW